MKINILTFESNKNLKENEFNFYLEIANYLNFYTLNQQWFNPSLIFDFICETVKSYNELYNEFGDLAESKCQLSFSYTKGYPTFKIGDDKVRFIEEKGEAYAVISSLKIKNKQIKNYMLNILNA